LTSNGSADGEIERRVLSETIKDRLLEWIVESRLKPGERLIETQIARDFGTSQAPVREAIKALATLGVVEIKPYQGARVRAPSNKELIDAIKVRTELEAMGARTAASRITALELATLDGLMSEMLTAAERHDAHAHALKNAEFHVTILRAARNDALERAWQMLEPFLRTYITATLPGVDLVWLARRHEKLIAALKAGDPGLADAAMREHLHEVEEATAALGESASVSATGQAGA
jgi:DNA-binding GntR family transcriptional regulator